MALITVKITETSMFQNVQFAVSRWGESLSMLMVRVTIYIYNNIQK